jgi:hypothetical protein
VDVPPVRGRVRDRPAHDALDAPLVREPHDRSEPTLRRKIGDIDVHLYRGAYSIEDIRLIKTTGNVPVPLFAAKRVDLSIEWGALLHGSIVGRIQLEAPELNFVDGGEDESEDQSGGGGSAPWLDVIQDLFPFKINSARVNNGSVHFQTFKGEKPVDVYISELQAELDNLTNIKNEVTPLITTAPRPARDGSSEVRVPDEARPVLVQADVHDGHAPHRVGRDQAQRPEPRVWEPGLRARMVRLVVELDAREGQLEGYREAPFLVIISVNLEILAGREGVNPLASPIWEALVRRPCSGRTSRRGVSTRRLMHHFNDLQRRRYRSRAYPRRRLTIFNSPAHRAFGSAPTAASSSMAGVEWDDVPETRRRVRGDNRRPLYLALDFRARRPQTTGTINEKMLMTTRSDESQVSAADGVVLSGFWRLRGWRRQRDQRLPYSGAAKSGPAVPLQRIAQRRTVKGGRPAPRAATRSRQRSRSHYERLGGEQGLARPRR